MNASAPRGTAHVPTLTEVVHVDAPAPAEPAPPPQTDPDLEPEPDWSKTVVLPAEASPLDESQIAQNVLADMQRQIDLMLEYRLREAIGPVLARASDALIRELRTELASAMREIVARAVAQEIARHRGR
jgi:hypothetical protein